jgi:hypothetical protein
MRVRAFTADSSAVAIDSLSTVVLGHQSLRFPDAGNRLRRFCHGAVAFVGGSAHSFLRPSLMRREPSNQSVELTATRCAFTLQMTKTLSLRATLAPGGGSSLLSR